MNVMTNPTLL